MDADAGVIESAEGHSTESNEKADGDGIFDPIFSSPLVEVSHGRPDLEALIGAEIRESSGDISVTGVFFYSFASWQG